MRAASAVLYAEQPVFEYGKGWWLYGDPGAEAFLLSSGRGVHEALAAVKEMEKQGRKVALIDMPSVDERLIGELHDSGRPVIVAEQNNGLLWEGICRTLFRRGGSISPERFVAVNTLDGNGRAQYIHSATYGQLLERFGLSARQLAARIREILVA